MFTDDELKKMTPAQYAEQANAAAKARARSAGMTACFMLPTDPEYFARNGWETAYDYRLDMAKSELSDLFKSLYCFRPRDAYPWDAMDLAAVNAEIVKIQEELDAKVSYEEQNMRIAEEQRKTDARLDREARKKAMKAEPLTHNPFAALAGILK